MTRGHLSQTRISTTLTDMIREPMAAYRFGGSKGTLLRPGENGLMPMIG